MYLILPDVARQEDAFGREALSCYYQGSTKEEIERFIQNVVFDRNDPLQDARNRFFERHLLPPHGKTAAQNAIEEIERSLGWEICPPERSRAVT